MKKPDIKAEIIKALEGEDMDKWAVFWHLYWNCLGSVLLSDFDKALTELTESGEVISENGLYKLNSNQSK